jgi:uncharacterized membrane protein YeaQ/YmgE (transglycosylase-associated protein family)
MIWWICVGLVAGWATGKILKGTGYGALADIVIGILGAIVGGFVMRAIGFSGSGGFLYTVFVAVLGAMILVWLEHFFSGSRGHNY